MGVCLAAPSILCIPRMQGRRQRVEGRMGMQGLVANLRATLSSLSVGQLHPLQV